MRKPEPKTVSVICSVCDRPWDKHGAKPTLENCVELLKAECARLRVQAPYWQGQSSGRYPALVQARGVPLGDTQIGKAN